MCSPSHRTKCLFQCRQGPCYSWCRGSHWRPVATVLVQESINHAIMGSEPISGASLEQMLMIRGGVTMPTSAIRNEGEYFPLMQPRCSLSSSLSGGQSASERAVLRLVRAPVIFAVSCRATCTCQKGTLIGQYADIVRCTPNNAVT